VFVIFSDHDLYSKSPDMPDLEELRPYYQSLIDKYMPGKLKWWKQVGDVHQAPMYTRAWRRALAIMDTTG